MSKESNCAERIAEHMASREEAFGSLFKVRDGADDADVRDALGLYSSNDPTPEGEEAVEAASERLDEIPLSVTVSHVVTILLGYGGPSDEIRAFVQNGEMTRADYVFMDWGDGATANIPEDSALWRYAGETVEMLVDCGTIPNE